MELPSATAPATVNGANSRLSKLRGAISIAPRFLPWVLPTEVMTGFERHLDWISTPLPASDDFAATPELADVEVLLAGWESIRLDRAVLDRLPNLQLVLYAAGTVRYIVTKDFWDRGIPITSAAAANAIPTAHFAEAAIVLGLKQAWHYLARPEPQSADFLDTPNSGIHGATVGIIGLSRVGRLVTENLRQKHVHLLAYDPYASAAEASRLGVRLVPLAELFREADVVSLHAPLLPETEGLITGELLGAMKPCATFVNTARGAIVREQEMTAILRRRTDLTAVLDVTDPEPPAADSPLRRLPNVFLTPHIAGSRHRECAQLGRAMLQELERFVHGQPLRWQVTQNDTRLLA